MNNDHVLVRPIFRVLYGIVSAVCVGTIILGLVVVASMWHLKTLKVWGFLMWCYFIGWQFILLWFAYISFIIAIYGKLPKYLKKFEDRLGRKYEGGGLRGFRRWTSGGESVFKPYEYLVISISCFLVSILWIIEWAGVSVPWWIIVACLLGAVCFFVAFLRAKIMGKEKRK